MEGPSVLLTNLKERREELLRQLSKLNEAIFRVENTPDLGADYPLILDALKK